MTARISVLYFGGLKEALGRARDTVQLEVQNPTVATLYEALCRTHPRLPTLVSAVRLAVNEEFIDDAGPEMLPLGVHLTDGDVVAFIPPVTGG